MALVPFPTLQCFAEGWRIANPFVSGGKNALGNEYVIGGPTGRWEARMSFNVRRGREYADADGFLAALDGPANSFLIGPRDWRGRPWVTNRLTGELLTPDKTALNRSVNPDYDTNEDTNGTVSFSLQNAAQMNATQLVIKRNRGGIIRRGQYFSVGSRMYIIAAVNTVDSGAVGAQLSIDIRPWLREACDAGTELNFTSPSCEMRLSIESAAMVERNVTPLSSLVLDIVEKF